MHTVTKYKSLVQKIHKKWPKCLDYDSWIFFSKTEKLDFWGIFIIKL